MAPFAPAAASPQATVVVTPRGVPGDSALPRLPKHVVPSPEARALLDQSAPLAVIRGIQGYGKTTLVASWLGDQQDSVRWVWVSARSDGGDVLEVVDRAAGALTEGRPIILVIDDAHLLRDEPILHGLVRTLARHQHLHLVMCSRCGIPSRISRPA